MITDSSLAIIIFKSISNVGNRMCMVDFAFIIEMGGTDGRDGSQECSVHGVGSSISSSDTLLEVLVFIPLLGRTVVFLKGHSFF